MKNTINNICCIGAGYVGGPTMSVIADRCPHIKVCVVDINENRIKKWNSNNLSDLPVYEPGLDEVIKRCRGRNLNFSSNVKENIKLADMVFISVNTPTKTSGIGAGQASDLKWVEKCARQVAEYAKGYTIVVEKSTLPVKTAEVIKQILKAAQTSSGEAKSFDILSNPEFLAEGSAVNDLEFPDRVLIGGENEAAILALSNIYKSWVDEEKIIHTNLWSSELAKLTANAFLAQRISSINSIAVLCEATGADVKEVSKAIGSDSRIGSKFLNSGPGFGGSCFKKDILNLVYLSKYFGLPEVGTFWESVVKLNSWHKHRISELIVKKLFGTITGKKICILGFAFKANTNDTRESPAISICKDFLEEGAYLSIYDPKVNPNQISIDLDSDPINILENSSETSKINSYEGKWGFADNIVDSSYGADAIIILTEWEEYTVIDWDLISKNMRSMAWVFDARGIVNAEDVINSGLNFWRIGDGS